MSKGHRDWISADEIEILTFGSDKVCTGAVKVRVEQAAYARAAKCARYACPVILVWEDRGQEGAGIEQFGVESCTCDYQAMCCQEHRDTFECVLCCEEEEEEVEEEDRNERKRSAEEAEV